MIYGYLGCKIKILSLVAIIAVVYIHSDSTEPQMQLPRSVIARDFHINSFVQFFIANGLARFCTPLFFASAVFYSSALAQNIVHGGNKSVRSTSRIYKPSVVERKFLKPPDSFLPGVCTPV